MLSMRKELRDSGLRKTCARVRVRVAEVDQLPSSTRFRLQHTRQLLKQSKAEQSRVKRLVAECNTNTRQLQQKHAPTASQTRHNCFTSGKKHATNAAEEEWDVCQKLLKKSGTCVRSNGAQSKYTSPAWYACMHAYACVYVCVCVRERVSVCV